MSRDHKPAIAGPTSTGHKFSKTPNLVNRERGLLRVSAFTPWFSTPVFKLAILSIAVLTTLVGVLNLSVNLAKAATGINEQINFQARLLNADGSLVDDGNYNVQFKVYQDGDGALGGGDETLKWTEEHLNNASNGITVKNGYLSAQLGSITAFGSSVDWNQDTLWLSVNIGNTNGTCTPFSSCSGDGEMDPFMRFTAVPYALNAGQLGGLSSDDFVQFSPAAAQTDADSDNTINVNKTGSGGILNLADGGTSVLQVVDGGAATFKTTSDSTTGFQIFDADGGTAILTVDTVNERVILDKDNTGLSLEVNGEIRVKTDGGSRAISLYNTNNTGTGPDIDFVGGGLLAADDSLLLNIDSDNNGTTNVFGINTNSDSETGATRLLTVQENGNVGIGEPSPDEALDVIGNVQISEEGSDAYIELISNTLADASSTYIWSEDTLGFAVGGTAGTPDFIIDTNGSGFVGIGDATPDAALDVLTTSTATTAAVESGTILTITDTGVVTTGTDTTTGQVLAVTRTGATGGTINSTGLDIDVTGDTGGTSTVTGLDVTVSGADTNYAAIFSGGNVGIGDSSPASLLTVGDGDDFQVNSTGAITAATGITSSGTITLSGLVSCDTIDTNASGVLSCGTDDAGSGSSPFTDAGDHTYLTTTADNLVVGGTADLSAKLAVDGNADEVQFLVQGNATQTNDILVIENSGGTDLLSVDTTSVDVGVDLVVSAGNSLVLTGGATLPGSPVEGEIFWDSDDERLYIYDADESRWRTDANIATVIVAANDSDAEAKAKADYVADGTSDETEINSALTAGAGGVVVLLEGTYVADGTILIPNNTTLSGQGQGTVIELADIDATDNLIENSDQVAGTGVVIRDLHLDGRDDLNTFGTQNGIHLDDMGDFSTERLGAVITRTSIENFRDNGIDLDDSDKNSIYENNLNGFDRYGIELSSSDYNLINNNTVHDGGGTTEHDAIRLSGSNSNIITTNLLSDTSCTVDCWAIHLTSSSQYNYLSNNVLVNSGADPVEINDNGAKTIFANQFNSEIDATNSQQVLQQTYLGINDTNPDAVLDVLSSSTDTTAASVNSFEFTVTDTGVVTTGTDTNVGQLLSVTRTGATGGTINTTGLDIDVTGDSGGTSKVTGLDVNVTGADTNIAALFNGGNVGIGTSAPGELLALVADDTSILGIERTDSFDVPIRVGNTTADVYFGLSQYEDFTIGTGTDLFSTAQLTVQRSTGNVGIGDATPAGLLTVGTGDAFQVDASGNITTAGDLAVNGTDITSTGVLDLTPASGSDLTVTLATTGDFLVNTSDLVVDTSTGNVGINQVAPKEDFQVNGNAAIQSYGSLFYNAYWDGANAKYIATESAFELNHDAGGDYFIIKGAASGTVDTNITWSDGLIVAADGDIGINDTTPDAKLDVQGGSSGVAALISNGTSTGDILQVFDNTTQVFGVADNGDVFSQTIADSVSAFSVQTAGDEEIFTIDSTNDRVKIGESDTVGTTLVLDTKTGSGDPTGVAGAMYYNSNSGKFRCYTTAWADCDTTGGAGSSTVQITLAPEFAGGTLSADGTNNSGTMTADHATGLSSAQGYKHNYYEWTTANATAQDYDIIINYQLPSDFNATNEFNASSWKVWTYSDTLADTAATIKIEDQDLGTACVASDNIETTTVSTWEQITLTTNPNTNCVFSPDDIITITINVSSSNSSVLRLGEISFEYDT